MNETVIETEIVQKVKTQLFKKGQSGNPLGRGKGNLSMTTLLRSALVKLNKGETITPAEKISLSLIRQAEVGELKAIEMVLDRIDGKPTQQINQVNVNVEPLKDEQRANLLKLLE